VGKGAIKKGSAERDAPAPGSPKNWLILMGGVWKTGEGGLTHYRWGGKEWVESTCSEPIDSGQRYRDKSRGQQAQVIYKNVQGGKLK